MASLAPVGVSAASRPAAKSHVNLAQLAKDVNQAASLPQFSTYAKGYGSPIKNPKALRGGKIMIIPGAPLAACEEIAQAEAQLATELGMKPTIFQNNGTTTAYNTAINDAISQGYKAITPECAMNPATIAPAIAQAKAHGIKVVSYGATRKEMAQSKVQGNTVDPWGFDAKIAAEQAVYQHHGKPFQAIAITSNQAPATAIMEAMLKKELHAICPACTLTEVNVEVPQWSSSIASTLTSALIRNPKATVVFPDYAGMLTYVLAGITAAHKTSTVKTYLAFGGGTPFIQMQAQQPGASIIQSDIGGYPVWTGYLLMLQTARVLQGMPPISYDNAYGPDRVCTPQNAVEFLKTGGWGTSFVNGFRGLLGLKPLSGKALFNASTLNGAMTAKV